MGKYLTEKQAREKAAELKNNTDLKEDDLKFFTLKELGLILKALSEEDQSNYRKAECRKRILEICKKYQIEKAINFLRKSGYAIKKITAGMQKDADECEASDGDKECLGCDCSVCIMQ